MFIHVYKEDKERTSFQGEAIVKVDNILGVLERDRGTLLLFKEPICGDNHMWVRNSIKYFTQCLGA